MEKVFMLICATLKFRGVSMPLCWIRNILQLRERWQMLHLKQLLHFE